MFGSYKVKLEGELLGKIKKCVEAGGYESVDEFVVRVLEKEGWVVREAENGKAGLRAVSENKPAVILLDLMMPVMNGFDFIQELRKNKSWQDIPVVILTAKDLTSDDREQLRHAVAGMVMKGSAAGRRLISAIQALDARPATTFGSV